MNPITLSLAVACGLVGIALGASVNIFLAALQLRAMNIIYETTKERGTTILIPTSMVDSLNLASVLVLAGQGSPSQDVRPLKTAA